MVRSKGFGLLELYTDFDFYDRARDGNFRGLLSAPASRDDVVRAHNAAVFVLGEDY